MSSGKWRPFCCGLNVLKHLSLEGPGYDRPLFSKVSRDLVFVSKEKHVPSSYTKQVTIMYDDPEAIERQTVIIRYIFMESFYPLRDQCHLAMIK